MTESRLFMSSCSRRELAHRRPGRSAPRLALVLGLLVVLVCAAAFLLARGGV
jgi:hypothetical protein